MAEEERRRIEESLLKSHANNDRLKDEREKLQQEKDKLRLQAETEIERLKEELRQQKDGDNRLRSRVNRRLKQKTEDFHKLYWEHKQTEADYKRRGAEFDRQQDRLKELPKEARTDLAQKMDKLEKKTEALAKEKTKAVAMTKLLEEAA